MKVNFKKTDPEHNPMMDNRELFQKYIEICNQALEANANRFPFKQILGAAKSKADSTRLVEVSIIDDKPEETFVIYLQEEKITGTAHSNCADCNCDGEWKVPKSYLEDVIQHPQSYINNPAKIDWDWMYETKKD